MARRRRQAGGSRLRAYSLLIIVVLGVACLVGWGVGKVFITPSPETTPNAAVVTATAQQLANLDGGVGLPADYQTVLDSLRGKCTQDEAGIAQLVDSAHDNLQQHGITTLTRLVMLQYLDGEMAAGVAKADCGPLMTAYVQSKEG